MKQHPFFANYYASEDGQVYNKKTGNWLKGGIGVRSKRKLDNRTIELCLNEKKSHCCLYKQMC